MIRLEDLKLGMRVCGLVPDQVVEIIQVSKPSQRVRPFNETDRYLRSVQVAFKTADGNFDGRTVVRGDEERLHEAKVSLAFGDDAKIARLTWKAKLIRNAHLFDPYSGAYRSNIELLPHQIEAVYDQMLGRHPLRFLLADDPGAGKTVMAGLYIREMLARGTVQRCLIVVPGNLVEQWRSELRTKFRLSFVALTRDMINEENPFVEHDRLIASVDKLKRNEYRKKLEESDWHLVICDEAHKMWAKYTGQEIDKNRRYQLGEQLRDITRHFILMTATPHNGKEPEYQLFLQLLDGDRFEGSHRPERMRLDSSDIVLRRMKEQLVNMDGKPLFPERRAYTANYELSDPERELYGAVTDYCKHEFNRADQLEGGRRNTVGFALTVLQRRLASSPEAIYKSLSSRRHRLEMRLERTLEDIEAMNEIDKYDVDDLEELPAEDLEEIEDAVNELASASQTLDELRQEIQTLRTLESQADDVRRRSTDSKWDKLREIWERRLPEMERDGHARKLIIFTEHRATLEYLVERLGDLLGSKRSVLTIHGGIKHEQRRNIQDRFREDSDIQILVATDAAGEGINLQFAHLMINYDLPWNPNRLEQRFGRIHRIGQTEVCHLWNIVTRETREGSVYERLLQKLETIGNAFHGKVFDVIGELFEGEPLRDLLKQAIRYGDDSNVQKRLHLAIDDAVNIEHIQSLAQRRVLATDVIDVEQLRDRMDDVRLGGNVSGDVKDFLLRVFEYLSLNYNSRVGSEFRELESDQFGISRVPGVIVRFANNNSINGIRDAYARVSFDPVPVRIANSYDAPEFINFGHPLLEATIEWMLSHWKARLPECGEAIGVFLSTDSADQYPSELFYLEWTINSEENQKTLLDGRARIVQVTSQGYVSDIDAAFLDSLEVVACAHRSQVSEIAATHGFEASASESDAKAFVDQHHLQPHLEEVQARESHKIEMEWIQVEASLQTEIEHEQLQIQRHRREQNRGLEVAAENRKSGLERRLQDKRRILENRSAIMASAITVNRVAVIVPASLLRD